MAPYYSPLGPLGGLGLSPSPGGNQAAPQHCWILPPCDSNETATPSTLEGALSEKSSRKFIGNIIDPHKYRQLIFDKGVKRRHSGEKTVLSTNGAGTTGHPRAKIVINVDMDLTYLPKMGSE